MKTTKQKEAPKAVITITDAGDKSINVSIEFTPSAPTKGKIARAHAAGMEMVKLFAEAKGGAR